MDAAPQQATEPAIPQSTVWKTAAWFLLHTTLVYVSVNYCSHWLAGWLSHTFLPHLRGTGVPPMSAGIQLMYSHLFVMSFVPAATAGSLNARFRQRSAWWVWVVPTVLLVVVLMRYPHSLLDQSWPGISYYFGDVEVPEYSNFFEMGQRIGPWMFRLLAQKNFTAPFYAGIGYSLAAWASMRWRFYSLGQREAEAASE
jgi:hypothetical protein